MSDSINIGAWSQNAFDPAADEQAGLGMYQREAQQSALRNVDLNNPDSVGNAMTGLVKAGGIDAASSLATAGINRLKYGAVPGALDQYKKGMAEAFGGADQSSAAQPAPAAPAQPNPQHVYDTMTLANHAVTELQNTPLEERAAAFEKIKADMIARGVPEQAIDEAGSDLSDSGLAKHGQYYSAVAQHLEGQPGVTPVKSAPSKTDADGNPIVTAPNYPTHVAPETLPADGGAAPGGGTGPTVGGVPAPAGGGANPSLSHPTGYAWTKYILNHPGLSASAKFLQSMGLPAVDYLPIAREIEQPEIQKEAEENHAESIAKKSATGTALGKADVEGIKVNVNGVETTVTPEEHQFMLQHPELRAKIGYGQDLSPEEKAKQTAIGSAATSLVDVPITDANGNTVTQKIPTLDYINGVRSGKFPAGVGVTATPQQEVANKGDAEAMVAERNRVAGQPYLADVNQRQNAATQAQALLKSINPNTFTPNAQHVADFLNAVSGGKLGAKDANNLATYQKLADQGSTQYFSLFPGQRRTDADLKFVKGLGPGMTTPHEAAGALFAQQGAMADKERAYSDFVAQHPEIISKKALDQAWNQGEGKVSVFASPRFDGVTYNGHPLRVISPKPDAQGHQWGVLYPGTANATVFQVK